MFFGEQEGQGSRDQRTPRNDKSVKERARVVKELGEGRSAAQIGRELGVSRQRIGQIKKEEGVPSPPKGKQVIYEKAREAGKPPQEYVRELVSQKRPYSAARDIGVSDNVLRKTMKDMGIRSTAPRQDTEQGKQSRAAGTRKSIAKIPEDHLPRIAENLEKGNGNQTLYARQYDTTQPVLSSRLRRAGLFSGRVGRRPKNPS